MTEGKGAPRSSSAEDVRKVKLLAHALPLPPSAGATYRPPAAAPLTLCRLSAVSQLNRLFSLSYN